MNLKQRRKLVIKDVEETVPLKCAYDLTEPPDFLAWEPEGPRP